jgi:hypothetical protein
VGGGGGVIKKLRQEEQNSLLCITNEWGVAMTEWNLFWPQYHKFSQQTGGEIKSGKSEGRKIRGPNKRGCRREKK